MELAGFWRRMDGEGELGFIGRRGPMEGPFAFPDGPVGPVSPHKTLVIVLLILDA